MNSWNPYSTLNLQKLEATDIFQAALKKLKENRWYKPILDFAEESTKISRVYLVCGLGSLFTLLLLLEYGTTLIGGCIGFLYPGYKTLGELEKGESGLGRKWLMYWFLHAALNFFEIFLFFLYWIPGYWIIKSIFLAWCYAPLHRNGADVIYDFVIHPLFQKNHEAIDNALNQVVKAAHSIYTDADAHNTDNGHVHQN
ncbi:receptor expression-enhancing protein 6 [Caerostris extrusa]|uniref:Receptor expression-enhancing protein n=1 Tax=Caerostris extrusa TaxID=172846 RepID=A0AAV4MES3_CAEEX|nr:receptor expression-enhancing protein 6 [Caerostris extrusa]